MVRVVCVLAVVGAGVLAALASGRAATGATIVAVTAGSPTEFAFHLPRVAATGAGTFVFRIRNAGRRPHTFEICTTPVASAAANTCVGKVTKTIPAGRSATLTVTLATPGRYEFLSTLRGEAKRGMKGLFVVETAPPAVQTTTTS